MDEWAKADTDYTLLKAIISHHFNDTPFPIETLQNPKFDFNRWQHIWLEERLLLFVFYYISQQKTKPSFFSALKERAKTHTLRQLVLKKTLLEISESFNKKHICFVILKGLPLNEALWGNNILRMPQDIDILIAPKDIIKADAVLKKLGFSTDFKNWQFKLHQKFPHLLMKKDATYIKAGFPSCLEMHWKTAATDILFFNEKYWQKGMQFENNMPVLSDLDNLIYLCYHAARHHWHRKVRLLDIAQFMKIKAISQTELRAYAKLKKVTLVVEEAFYLMQRYFGMDLENNLTKAEKSRLLDLINKTELISIPNAPFTIKIKKLITLLRLNQKSNLKQNLYIQLRLVVHAFLNNTLKAFIYCQQKIKDLLLLFNLIKY